MVIYLVVDIMDTDDLIGKVLIAVPGLDDPNFSHTVVLVCDHSSEGTFGIILNRVLINSLKPMLKAFDLREAVVDMPIYYGGPVRPDQGYVIYDPFDEKYGAMKITRTLAVTTSKDILHDIAAGKGPKRYLFALGFAGWTSNQLEEELMADSWLIAPFDPGIIFNTPANERWRQAAMSIGVDLDCYIRSSGRA